MPAFPTDTLEEAWRLLGIKAYEPALDIYEKLLRTFPADMRSHIETLPNLNAHKALLKQRVFRQILKQSDHSRGFHINFGDYCFLGRPAPDVFISPKAIAAVDRYKGGCGSISALKAEAQSTNNSAFADMANSPHGATFLYCAHSVSADLVDLCLLGVARPLSQVADYGTGAGIQAASLAVMMPQIQRMYLYEQQDFMIEAITDIFACNKVDRIRINAPFDGAVDFFYSMRACTYLFSIDAYYDGIRAGRSAQAWAMFDIGGKLDAAYETSRLRSLFNQKHVFYEFGKAPDNYVRTVFLEPAPRV